MGAYLTDHPPVRDQWYDERNRPLTGCTVLHSTESAFDEMGVDTGAENVADFIRRRTTPGSYHDLVDSDSDVPLVDYNHGAYHDGTGSNNWALSLAFACRTVDWNRMSPAKRAAMLRNGARAFVRQQAYRRLIGAPLTELRLITKAQSDAGMSGFTYHGFRDPDRRTDPGVAPPNLFPFDEFLAACRAELAGIPLIDPRGPEMRLKHVNEKGHAYHDRIYAVTDHEVEWITDPAIFAALRSVWGEPEDVSARHIDLAAFDANARRARHRAEIVAAVASQVTGADVDEQALGRIVVDGLTPALVAALADKTGATREDVEEVLRGIFVDAGTVDAGTSAS